MSKKQIRERDIERHLVKRVKELGGECRKVKWIGRTGAPDRLAMLPEIAQLGPKETEALSHFGLKQARPGPAQTIWIELKAPGKKPEPHQLREHERMRAMGQRVEVVDSFARVDEVLS